MSAAAVEAEDRLQNAMDAYQRDNTLRITDLAREFGVPYPQLYHRAKVKPKRRTQSKKESSKNNGARHALNRRQEDEVRQWRDELDNAGHPPTGEQLRFCANSILREQHTDPNSPPPTVSKMWAYRYLKRHPRQSLPPGTSPVTCPVTRRLPATLLHPASPMAAKLIDRRVHNVPGKLRVAELFFDVPVNHSKPDDGTLRLFARSVSRLNTTIDPEPSSNKQQLPWMVYLQGGPGMGCRAPQDYGWIGTVLDKGYQILFLDQRGTGLSSTITAGTLSRQGNAVKQAEYLKNFRADSIVRDCEAVRHCLTADYPNDKRKWSVIGQSFGSFCAVTYLSKYPEGLREAFLCGGLPPVVNGPDEVYAHTFDKVEQRNQAYYAKFPEDVERIRRIVQYLKENRIPLASGQLTPERFQQLGILFGMHGGLDAIHDIVLRAWNDLETFGGLTLPTLNTIDAYGGFDNNVIYAILHEAIYCQGQASNWSAHRIRSSNPRFQIDSDQPLFFTGEMIFKDMFDSYTELNQIKEAADILAATHDWPVLYNENQLARNKVPVYAASYIDDMYVHFELASRTATKINGIKQFITNVMYHDALRSKSDELMRQLFALREDSID